MTKISSYVTDDLITGGDKWIGSDVSNFNKTKNFTPKKLAVYFNGSQVINTGMELLYKYFTVAPSETRPAGTISFENEIGPVVSFSSITTFLISKSTQKGNNVDEFLGFLVGTKSLLYKADDVNVFGYYDIVSIEPYVDDNNFYVVILSFIEGNGSIEEDMDYMISMIDINPTEAQDLQSVTDLGSTTTNSITANSFIKKDGTGLNVLLDDGNTKLTTSILGTTNLTPSQTASSFTINSDTGSDATIPLGNGALAGASLNNYTTAEQTKLAGIATGAEVNVNADWNAVSGDAEILNKPTIPSISGLATITYVDTQDALKVDKVAGSRLITSSESTILGNTSGVNTGDQDLTNLVVKNTAIVGATKTKITYDSKGLVTVGEDATTVDIADTTNKRYVTDANLVTIANQSGTNTGDNATNSQYSELAASKQDNIILTTTGTSGASTLDGATLNIPQYSGATNLTTSQTSTNFTINSSTGDDASVPLGNGTLAGATLNDYTSAEKTKLAGIATEATANSSDATLLARANHTGTQTASTISDIQSTITNNTSVLANTAKISFDSTSSTRLANTSGTNTGDDATNSQYSGLATSKVTANTAITGATNTKITYDSKGLVTAGVNATTDDIGEGITNLYWSNSKTISSVLNGISISGTSIISTDTILQALGKAQNQINSLAGGVTYQGVWNASINDPVLTSSVGTKGYYYVVSVAGSTNLNDITDWKLGDWAIYNGTLWQKVDNTDAVISVNGYTGIVTITTADVPDSTNKRYVTDANLTVINNTSNTNTGDQDLQSVTTKGAITTTSITAESFIKSGGGSPTQFLMGDGSVTIGNGGVYTYEIHVSQINGNDTTGTGAVLNPVASITKALTLVGGLTKTIVIHPGNYTENPNIAVQYTVLTTYAQLGGNTALSGTITVSTGCTISGLKMTNLTINAPTGTGNVNILNCDISGTLTRTNTGTYTLIRFCDIGTTNITGSGLVAIFGGNPRFVTVNNAAASIIVKNAVAVAPVLIAGNANFVDCIIPAIATQWVSGTTYAASTVTSTVLVYNLGFTYARIVAGAGSTAPASDPTNWLVQSSLNGIDTRNAITTAIGSVVTIANSQIIVPTFQNVARVSLSGFYSILNCVYDKPNSTLVALSETGGSTDSIVYSQFINADKFIKQGGTGLNVLLDDGNTMAVSTIEGAVTAGTSLQYYRGDKTFQTLNTTAVVEDTNLYYTQARFDNAFSAKSTTNLTEGTNLYYLNSRARTALSFVAGSGAYDNATGLITIPTNNTQIINGSNYITLGSLSSSATGLTYTNTTGVFSLTSGYLIPTSASYNNTNWDTAYADRNKWDGGATGLDASTGRTSLGATVIGSSVFTSTSPSAITFLRANVNNTVSWLDAASFRTAIGAGSGAGSVTSVAQLTLTSAVDTDLTSSVANGTSAAVITLNVPDAGINSRGVVTAAAQTFAGNKTFVGSSIFKGTLLNDGTSFGSEILTPASVSTNWVGTSFATGYQHTAGNVSVLQDSHNVLTDSVYQVQYTLSYTSSPAGSFTISVGGNTSPSKSAVGTSYYTLLTTSISSLTITPSSTFNGKIIISLKIVNPSSSVITIQSSNGVIRNEFRYTAGGSNMFLGFNSGGYNSSGSSNTFVGFNSGRFNSTGSDNTALGQGALYNNTFGSSNIAIGGQVLSSNLTGYDNTAIGVQALFSNIDGYNNNAFGTGALTLNTEGYSNNAFGSSALGTNTTGHDNVAIGENSLTYNTTGSSNVALGSSSGSNIIGGSFNTLIGSSTSTATASDIASTVIGFAATGLGDYTTVIGNGSTVKTGIFGRTLIGTTTLPTDDLTSVLQVKGYVSATGYKVPYRSGFLKADGIVDDNTYSTGGGTASGTNTGDETAARIGTLINGSGNATPNDTDYVATSDATTPLLKKITWTNVKLFLKTYFDTLYSDKAYNIYINQTVSFDTTATGTYNGSGTYTQNGRNVMVFNGANPINITCVTAAPSDFIASYTKLGTSAITFVAVSSNITAFGNVFTISGAVGSTALLTRNGAGQYYLQINNL